MENNLPVEEVNPQQELGSPYEPVETETLENQPEPEAPKPLEPEKAEKSKELQSALAQKEHFRKKAEEAMKQVQELQKKPESSMPSDLSPLDVVKLGKSLAKYSEDETESIITYAKGKFDTTKPTPNQIIEASKDEWVQSAIQSRREKVAKENKIPGPSSPSGYSRKSSEDMAKLIKGGKFREYHDVKNRELDERDRGSGI